ncbi:hypothetical protein [Xenorhabdus cabanillasii]|uniref:hypothetical protein n=1 Tax=Xenorhabdus cabanillasii TaxID=351673 RepID=UPI002B411EFB|nr:hypothetical protein [Xenorhabdus sp. Flor]
MSVNLHILKNILIYILESKFNSLVEYLLSILKKYFGEDTDMFQKLYQIPFYLGMLLLTGLGNSAFAETPSGSMPPTIRMLNIPPVTPQEAAEYLNKRVVPPSSFIVFIRFSRLFCKSCFNKKPISSHIKSH